MVQCKQYNYKVSPHIVREFAGAMYQANADIGYIITTNYFSKESIADADYFGIELVDIDKLVRLSREFVDKQINIKVD